MTSLNGFVYGDTQSTVVYKLPVEKRISFYRKSRFFQSYSTVTQSMLDGNKVSPQDMLLFQCDFR